MPPIPTDTPVTDGAAQQPPSPRPTETRGIVPQPIEVEMERSYIDYAMSVIIGRALPDVRDGLKPVHRRILYGMRELGNLPNRPHKKSARIVGDVLGKFHPHGDTAVYDAMVRMAQGFALRHPLVDGHGNWGSVDGDNAAAMRYTEARLAPIALDLLEELDMETVGWQDNFDATLQEPLTLPARFPQLVVNGASGIAVGMSTSVPPHNLGEVIDATVALLHDPSLEVTDLMQYVQGPDFPTGGIINGIGGVALAYRNGRGTIRVRAHTGVDEEPGGKRRIIVSEIPYQVNKSTLLEGIAEAVRDKRVEGVTDLRDESDRAGMHIVLELRRDAIPDVVLNQLFAHTQLEVTFGIHNLAIVDGEPRLLGLKGLLAEFIRFRTATVRRRTAFELRKARERAHIVEGLLVAHDNLDAVISLIRASADGPAAAVALQQRFTLSEPQAAAILDLKLQRLTSLEVGKLHTELTQLHERIRVLEGILADPAQVSALIEAELQSIKATFADARRTQIISSASDLEIEDLIPNERVVITYTARGYLKRVPVAEFRSQHRGGIGVRGAATKEEDAVADIFTCTAHSHVLFFTSLGRVHWRKAWQIPEGGRHSAGRPAVTILGELLPNETVATLLPIVEFSPEDYLLFATRRGVVKKTTLRAFSRPRRGGIWAIRLREGDELVDVRRSRGDQLVLLHTAAGKAVLFEEGKVRPMGRNSQGVRGVSVRGTDRVVSMTLCARDETLLTVTSDGQGKRSSLTEYRLTNRGAGGVIGMHLSKGATVVEARTVASDDELLVTTASGQVVRIPISSVPVIGRATKGVRVMRLHEGDTVTGVTRLATTGQLEAALSAPEGEAPLPAPVPDDSEDEHADVDDDSEE